MGILELIFVALLIGKLTGWFVISWWWVFAPLIPAILIYCVIFCLIGLSGILLFIDNMKGNK